MTCVWDGILSLLKLEEINRVFNISLKNKPRCSDFVLYLQQYNIPTRHVEHQGLPITSKQMEENQERIKNIDPYNLSTGYDCSGFDPILFLIAELFECDIRHRYNGVKIRYNRKNSTAKFRFISNTHHFWAGGRIEIDYN